MQHFRAVFRSSFHLHHCLLSPFCAVLSSMFPKPLIVLSFRDSHRFPSQHVSASKCSLEVCICSLTELLSCGIACAVLSRSFYPGHPVVVHHLHFHIRHKSRFESVVVVQCGKSSSFHLRSPSSILWVATSRSWHRWSASFWAGRSRRTTLRPVQPYEIATLSKHLPTFQLMVVFHSLTIICFRQW